MGVWMIRFSLVVCTYERPEPLRECLKSISRLDYDPSAYEVVVINDGSTADYKPVLEEYQRQLNITYVKIPHGGTAAARNSGMDASHGEFLCYIDDDFTVSADYLRVSEQFFKDYPTADVLTFGVKSCGESPFRHVQTLYFELVLRSTLGDESLEGGRVIRSSSLPASRAAVFRKTVFSDVGRFDESLIGGDDGELTTRLRMRGIPIYFLPDYYVSHWEKKGLSGFLKQRVRYATNLYKVQKIREGLVPNEEWNFFNCVRLALRRYLGWIGLTWRIDQLRSFILLSPFLLLFLFTFYLTLFWRRSTDR